MIQKHCSSRKKEDRHGLGLKNRILVRLLQEGSRNSGRQEVSGLQAKNESRQDGREVCLP